MGNDWRQIMIKCAEVAATKEPYASKLDLTIINSENSAEAQSAAIDAMVEQGYNAILVVLPLPAHCCLLSSAHRMPASSLFPLTRS